MHMDEQWKKMISSGRLEERNVISIESVDSTNTLAMKKGRQGAVTGTLVIAETQSKGRGRLGKTWESPTGAGLYFSIILRPKLLPADLPKITLGAGLAVCKAIERETGLSPGLKWPNDILLKNRKCGGILTETDTMATTGPAMVVLGIGLNITTPEEAFSGSLAERATSLLAASGRIFSRSALLTAIVQEVEEVVARMGEDDFPEILAEWRKRDGIKGKEISCVEVGGRVVSGISLGPDENGVLHVQDSAGSVHQVLSGDINLASK